MSSEVDEEHLYDASHPTNQMTADSFETTDHITSPFDEDHSNDDLSHTMNHDDICLLALKRRIKELEAKERAKMNRIAAAKRIRRRLGRCTSNCFLVGALSTALLLAKGGIFDGFQAARGWNETGMNDATVQLEEEELVAMVELLGSDNAFFTSRTLQHQKMQDHSGLQIGDQEKKIAWIPLFDRENFVDLYENKELLHALKLEGGIGQQDHLFLLQFCCKHGDVGWGELTGQTWGFIVGHFDLPANLTLEEVAAQNMKEVDGHWKLKAFAWFPEVIGLVIRPEKHLKMLIPIGITVLPDNDETDNDEINKRNSVAWTQDEGIQLNNIIKQQDVTIPTTKSVEQQFVNIRTTQLNKLKEEMNKPRTCVLL